MVAAGAGVVALGIAVRRAKKISHTPDVYEA